jgi:hypothetical protein
VDTGSAGFGGPADETGILVLFLAGGQIGTAWQQPATHTVAPRAAQAIALAHDRSFVQHTGGLAK